MPGLSGFLQHLSATSRKLVSSNRRAGESLPLPVEPVFGAGSSLYHRISITDLIHLMMFRNPVALLSDKRTCKTL